MTKVRIGVTGPRKGVTRAQIVAITEWAEGLHEDVTEIHHGDCVGGDVSLVGALLWAHPGAVVHSHPTISTTEWRAWIKSDVHHDPAPPLERNHHIVEAVDLQVAAPEVDSSVSLTAIKGGTGHCMRAAFEHGTKLLVFWPNGTMEVFER